MRQRLVSIFFGVIFITALVSNAQAQMCGCMGGKDDGIQTGSMMMGGMGHQNMVMMHGMGNMQGSGMMMGDGNPMWKHLMSLGLDDKQKDALKSLRTKMIREMAKRMADKQVAGIELQDLLDKDSVDMKSVEASMKKSESLKTDMLLARIKAREEMKSILTPDQRKRLKEMMDGGSVAGCGMMGGEAEHKDMPMHEHKH